MFKQNLGNTGAEVSELTLGTWVYGGDGWSGSKEKESLEAIAAALESGMTTVDTAPIYGDGLSEEIVGKAIEGRREGVFLATKCGLVKENGRMNVSLKPESIEHEIDESLRRLKTEYIDLYQCHWPDPKTPIEQTMTAMNKLKEQGKIRHIGVSNFNTAQLREACQYAEVVSNQVQYSMLDRTIEDELLPFCKENGIGILAYGPLAGGVLTGKYPEPKKFAKDDARSFFYKYYEGEEFRRIHKLLKGFKEEFRKPLSQIAINWVRQQEGVSTVLVGCRNADQLADNAAATEWRLKDTEMDKINDLFQEIIYAQS